MEHLAIALVFDWRGGLVELVRGAVNVVREKWFGGIGGRLVGNGSDASWVEGVDAV